MHISKGMKLLLMSIAFVLLTCSTKYHEKCDVQISEVNFFLNKHNTLYLYHPQKIEFSIVGLFPSELMIQTSEGVEILKHDGETYVVALDTSPAYLHLGYLLSGDTNLLRTVDLKIVHLGVPETRWGAISNLGLPVPKAALMAQGRIYPNHADSFPSIGMCYSTDTHEIVSYKFNLTGSLEAHINVNGTGIPGSIKGAIHKSVSGDSIEITDVILRNAYNKKLEKGSNLVFSLK